MGCHSKSLLQNRKNYIWRTLRSTLGCPDLTDFLLSSSIQHSIAFMHLVRKTSSNDMLRAHWSLVYLPYLVFIKYLQANTAYSIITLEIKGFVSDVKTKKLSWSTYVICKINAVLIYAYSHWELSIPCYLFQTSTIQRFRVNICSNNDRAQCNTVSVKIIYYECVSFQGQLADSTRIYGHLIIIFKACFFRNSILNY